MSGHPGSHFGRQLKKERLVHGWNLEDLARKTGINAAHLSRIENGKRPPTEKIALACDRAFPERSGWFTEYYFDLQAWAEVPSWFKPWGDVETRAATLLDWSPGTVTGLLQTEGYATAQFSLHPGITAEQVTDRVGKRLTRQQHVLYRDDPPRAHFLVGERTLYCGPDAEVMTTQLRHLAEVAALPHVTIQVVPAECWHPGMAGGFTIADGTAYTESLLAGQVYADDQTVSSLTLRFDTIRAEALPASKSASMFLETAERWDRGVSPATQTTQAATASKLAPKRDWYAYGIPPTETAER